MSFAREDVAFWNEWNASTRERSLGRTETDQRAQVIAWMPALAKPDQELEIIDVGCGAGWLAPDLLQFGNVTGTDLSDDVLARAQTRWPKAVFISGDFLELELSEGAYDVVVTLEVIAHVSDQEQFVAKLGRLLRPGGTLIIATQNRRVLKLNRLAKAKPGQIRHHLTASELHGLLCIDFDIKEIRFLTPIFARRMMPDLARRALSKASRSIFGGRLERWLEKLGLGWSIMIRATKRDDGPRLPAL